MNAQEEGPDIEAVRAWTHERVDELETHVAMLSSCRENVASLWRRLEATVRGTYQSDPKNAVFNLEIAVRVLDQDDYSAGYWGGWAMLQARRAAEQLR